MTRFRGPSRPFSLKGAVLAGLLGSTFVLGGCSMAEGAWLGAWLGAAIGGSAEAAGIGALAGAGAGAVIEAESARGRYGCACCRAGHHHYHH